MEHHSKTPAHVNSGSIHILVDLQLLLPGGMNGGIKPGFFGLFEEMRELAGESLTCTFLTNTWSHGDLKPIRRLGDRAICCFALEGRTPDSSQFEAIDEVRLEGFPKGFSELGVELYYNPMCERLPGVVDVPIMVLHADVLHRDVPESLPPNEVQRREVFFNENCIRADRIQTISKFSQDRIEACFPESHGKVFYTHLPVQSRLDSSQSTNKKVAEFPYVLYPANFWAHKNHRFLLEVFENYLALNLNGRGILKLILSGNSDHESQRFMEEVRQNGLTDHIRFAGHLSSDEFAELFRNASALIFPSKYEGFGIPPLEAMNLGIPVLCSDAGSLPEVVQDGACILPLDDPTPWAEALIRISTDEVWRRNLVRSGQRVVNSFSLRAEASSLLTELRRLVG